MITLIKRIVFVLIILGIIYWVYWLIDRPGADKLKEDTINTTQEITESFGLNKKDIDDIFDENSDNQLKIEPEFFVEKVVVEEAKIETPEEIKEVEKESVHETKTTTETQTKTTTKTTTKSTNTKETNILQQLFK